MHKTKLESGVDEWMKDARRGVRVNDHLFACMEACVFDSTGAVLIASRNASLCGMKAAVSKAREFFGDDWVHGDVMVTNDADSGAAYACEVLAIVPVIRAGTLAGYVVVRGSISDLGGWEYGGLSPQAVDRWAEGARVEAVKLFLKGKPRREAFDVLRLNSRTPATTSDNMHALGTIGMSLADFVAENFDDVVLLASTCRADDLARVKQAVASIADVSAVEKDVAVPWSTSGNGRVKCSAEKTGGKLKIQVDGSAISPQPVNIGLHTAKDIAQAALQSALALQGLTTDAISDVVEIHVKSPTLVAAPLPSAVALGMAFTGHVLFDAVHAAIGKSALIDETRWRSYLAARIATGVDMASGKAIESDVKQIRQVEAQESLK